MKIRVTNIRCYIDEMPPRPWDSRLIKAFKRKSKDSYWIKRRTGGFGGEVNFISAKKGMFPTGLLPEVMEWAKKEDIPVKLDDRRKLSSKPSFDILTEFGHNGKTEEPYKLRDYQEGAVEAAIKGVELPIYYPRGLIKVATAGGKTLIARTLINQVNVPTLFVVERVNLASQTKKKFIKEYGMKPGDVGVVGGKTNEQGRLVTITTVQSSHKLEDLERFEMVIVDESHHAKAKTYIALLKSLKNCYYRFGLSGTVFGNDALEDTYRVSQFGPILYEIGTKKLVDEGVLAKPTIRFIEVTKPFSELGDWHEQYNRGIVTNFDRNGVIIRFAQGFEGKTLVLFKIIEHGKILHKYLPKAIYVDGETPMDVREKMFEGFNRMDEGVMIASTILDEGIDFERIHHLIVAGGGKSTIKNIQRLGRGLRVNDNMQVNVIDFFDRTCKTLEVHSRARMKTYKAEGHTIRIFERNNDE